MNDIFQFSTIRRVEPVRGRATPLKGIFTHLSPELELLHMAGETWPWRNVDMLEFPISVSAMLDTLLQDPPATWSPAGELYDTLLLAYTSRDIGKILDHASSYFEKHGLTRVADLKSQAQLIAEYLGHANPDVIGPDVITFAARVPNFASYFERRTGKRKSTPSDFEIDLKRVSDSLLCARVLRLPSSDQTDLLRMLRTLVTMYYLRISVLALKSGGVEVPLDIFREVWRMPIYLPGWAFDINPCCWRKDQVGAKKASKLAQLQKVLSEYDQTLNQVAGAVGKGGTDSNCQCDKEGEPDCVPQNPCCSHVHLYVADYYVLRDETYAYKPGDLAYIEVVAGGETRKRMHSSKSLIEDYTESESVASKKEERDHQVTERSSLQSEINKVIDKQLNAQAKVGGLTNSLITDAKLSRSDSERVSREAGKELVEKAVLSLQEEIRTRQTRKVTSEISEVNKHIFKNDGEVPKVTQYFWVTQQKKAQIFSYNKRATVELIVPGPARLYEELTKRKIDRAFRQRPESPKSLSSPEEDLNPKDITTANFEDYVRAYSLDEVAPPPPDSRLLQITITGEPGDPKEGMFSSDLTSREFSNWPVVVPDGYSAIKFEIDGTVSWNIDDGGTGKGSNLGVSVKFALNDEVLFYGAEGNHTTSVALNGLRGEWPIRVDSWNATKYNVIAYITCVLDPERKEAWRQGIFYKIMSRYREQLAAFEQELDEHRRTALKELKGRHPFFNREIERTELKRAAVYLMCQSFDRRGPVNSKSEPCGLPEMDREMAQELGYDWYFWDRAFDWDLMGYAFFDYFWNPMCMWPEKFDPDDQDALFKAFRRAGYARVLVPVAEGMEDDVEYYLATGEKWGTTGAPPKNPNDTRWRDLATEIKHQRHCHQEDREGLISCDLTATNARTVTIKGTNRYWVQGNPGHLDLSAIDLDMDREIYIDLKVYRIMSIGLSSASDAPDTPTGPNSLWWDVVLDREFEGDQSKLHNYAIGAKFIGAPFLYELPTELVWAGARGPCLPSYPVLCEEA